MVCGPLMQATEAALKEGSGSRRVLFWTLGETRRSVFALT